MKTHELRQSFLDFYAAKGHVVVPGVSTIPTGDATILFTIAGMAPFKDVLAGRAPRKHARVANSQKCIRAADLEDVGLDGRHLTMFEMLGLWSFGDYFKKEAIAWSHEFISRVARLDMSRIWVTVHESDDEAAGIWQEVGVPASRIVRLGDKDNFWSMGQAGPCGPCTEIYFDQGPSVGCEAGQGPTPGAVCRGPGCDCDRYLEFWNNVFMQFNRDENGVLHPLPARNVDTGVGLERLAAICQGKTSAYDTDAFATLQRAVCHKSGIGTAKPVHELGLADRQSIQVISDHMRTLVVTLADGANFSNEGRGYVLRRILRRAMRYGHRLLENHGRNSEHPFLYRLAEDVAESLGDFYPELRTETPRVSELIRDEEERFLRTLMVGLGLFRSRVDELLKDRGSSPGHSKGAQATVFFPGADIFALHDSYGFPADLTALLCRENGLTPDLAGFEKLMDEQKSRSRAHSRFFDATESPFIPLGESQVAPGSTFIGYDLPPRSAFHQLPKHLTQVMGSPEETQFAEVDRQTRNARAYRIVSDDVAEVIFGETPFYPEGGGQLSDHGYVVFGDTPSVAFEVTEVHKRPDGIVHRLNATPPFNQKLTTEQWHKLLRQPQRFYVDVSRRRKTARNHSATHLLHAALREVLGTHVRQAGSQVSASGLRFDFTHPRALTSLELKQVETRVLAALDDALDVITHPAVPLEEARKMGALAMFDEKYDDHVRVLEMGQFSMELCGGTHVSNTSQIGSFRIVSESSVTSGVRRIEAITGTACHELALQERKQLEEAARLLRCRLDEVPSRIEAAKETERQLAKRIGELESIMTAAASKSLGDRAEEIAPGLPFLAHNMGVIESLQGMESLADSLRQKTCGVVVLGAVFEGKAQLLVSIHGDALKRHAKLSAGVIVRNLASAIGGKGGGKADFAKAGGSVVEGLGEALVRARQECLTLSAAN